MLDRAGHGAPTKVQGTMLHAYLTVDEIEEIKQRVAESGVLARNSRQTPEGICSKPSDSNTYDGEIIEGDNKEV
jgi:hypothetical protein